jgi:hypothetical protein
MITSKRSLAVAGLVLSPLWATAAEATKTAIFTITGFQSTQPGGSSTGIQSVTGYWTEGTTDADDTSNITVIEGGFGGTATYTLTGPKNGPGWTVTSQYFSPSSARFVINPFGPGPVSTGVPVSLTDVLFDLSGTVTITEKKITSAPEPLSWQ